MEIQNEGIIIVRGTITREEVTEASRKMFGDMIKAVVDVDRGILALGGELHADEEAALLDDGSRQQDLWGINIYHGLPRNQWVEFDSMINIRPSQGNRSRSVDDPEIRKVILGLVDQMIIG